MLVASPLQGLILPCCEAAEHTRPNAKVFAPGIIKKEPDAGIGRDATTCPTPFAAGRVHPQPDRPAPAEPFSNGRAYSNVEQTPRLHDGRDRLS